MPQDALLDPPAVSMIRATMTPYTQLKVIAIIVSYFGADSITKTVAMAAPQVSQVLIVDNSSDRATRALLNQLESPRINIIYNTENVGLAAAMNQGIEFAKQHGFDAVLFLDQDSKLLLGSAAALKSALRPGVGIASTQYRVIVDGQPAGDWLDYDGTIEVDRCWNAGSLVPLSVFDHVGGYREDFFVDYVDYEFNYRVRKAGLKILQVAGAKLIQRRGNMVSRSLLWRRCITSNYSASRHYWITRNGLILWREAGIRLWNHLAVVLNEAVKVLLYESQKRQKLFGMLRGIRDGLR
jgi:rhamnosyltransferase